MNARRSRIARLPHLVVVCSSFALLRCSVAPGGSPSAASPSDDAGTTIGAPGNGGGTTGSGGGGTSDASDAAAPPSGPSAPSGSSSNDGGAPSSGTDAGGEQGDDASSGTAADGGWWRPTSAAPAHFHWQLSDAFTAPADEIAGQGTIVYDIDGESNDAATVAQLHALGPNVKVVCYVDVGTYENYRSDASSFPAAVLGATNGWPGEKWLDVRQQSILMPIMQARFQSWCVDKGFDAIEPDNLDAWQNSSGFPLTEADNVSYDLAIAALAHSFNLSVGLKNVPSNAVSMEPSFDWALDEQCFEFNECDSYQTSFLAKGKAVWDVEYNTSPDCTQAASVQMNAQLRDLNLVAPGASGYVYTPCVPDTQATW